MTSTTRARGGSFSELRDQHLPLFGGAEHRHDRGWPHSPREENAERAQKPWRTAGILHFRHDDQEDG